MKYSKNLRVIGNNVYSYNTHVATIEGNKLIRLKWYSKTTSKHVNHVADELGLTVVEAPNYYKPAKDEGTSIIKTAAIIAQMADFLAGDTLQEKNAWKKQMLRTQPGISFPDDWDNLSEAEKQIRLNKAVKIGLSKH